MAGSTTFLAELLCATAVLLMIAQSAYGIECYTCDPCSADPFSTTNVATVSCSSGCLKVKATGPVGTLYSRSCAAPTAASGCSTLDASSGGLTAQVIACVCSSDKCNTGARYLPGATLISVMTAATVMATIR